MDYYRHSGVVFIVILCHCMINCHVSHVVVIVKKECSLVHSGDYWLVSSSKWGLGGRSWLEIEVHSWLEPDSYEEPNVEPVLLAHKVELCVWFRVGTMANMSRVLLQDITWWWDVCVMMNTLPWLCVCVVVMWVKYGYMMMCVFYYMNISWLYIHRLLFEYILTPFLCCSIFDPLEYL